MWTLRNENRPPARRRPCIAGSSAIIEIILFGGRASCQSVSPILGEIKRREEEEEEEEQGVWNEEEDGGGGGMTNRFSTFASIFIPPTISYGCSNAIWITENSLKNYSPLSLSRAFFTTIIAPDTVQRCANASSTHGDRFLFQLFFPSYLFVFSSILIFHFSS